MDPDILSALATFRRQYLQLVEPGQLRWPGPEALKKPDVQSWIFSNLFDVDSISSLPPERYRMRVLKVLISKLEKSITNPEEDVWLPFFSAARLSAQKLENGNCSASSPDLVRNLGAVLCSPHDTHHRWARKQARSSPWEDEPGQTLPYCNSQTSVEKCKSLWGRRAETVPDFDISSCQVAGPPSAPFCSILAHIFLWHLYPLC